jgi:acyl-CoA thioester hydrolase
MNPGPFKLQIRFADIDLMKHVNNAVYLSYFEMTRVHYFEHLLGQKWNYNEDGFLLARNEIDYIAPVFLQDKPEIHMSTDKIGNKSFTLSYEIHVNGVIKTKGKSIMVAFNGLKNKSIPIPVKLIEALELLKK